MSTFVAEIIGTAVLILLGDGVVAGVSLNKSKAKDSGWIVITFAWGLAVSMGVFASGEISGAHLNPAVTVGLASIGKFPWAEVPMYIFAQLIGAFIGAVLVWLTYLPHWKETESQESKLAVFCTAPAIRDYGKNMLTEIIGTFMLVFGILFIGTNNLQNGVSALSVGLLVFVIGMSLGGPTGYAINPARDLGPRIAHAILPIHGKGKPDWKYSWVPVIGPIIGGIIGAFTFNLIF